MKMVAVISTLNSKYIHSSLAPWCLLAGIRKYGNADITAYVVEGTINEPLGGVCARITERNPDVVGFSCYIWNIMQTLELISLVKKSLPNAVIVLGGPEVSCVQAKILNENPYVDFVISGEGELPFALLLNAVSQGEYCGEITGVSFRRGAGNSSELVISDPNISGEEPPSPYTDEYFQAVGGRITYLETSRGCPYSCAFCLSGSCGSVRFFNIARAKDDIISLANSGTKTVKFVDRTFNADKKRARELFEFIIENHGITIPYGVCFHFEIAGDILDAATIGLLKTAPVGLIQLEIGVQSFNKETLSYINRKTDIEAAKNNIAELTRSANMHIHIDLIAGLPLEDFASFRESFNAAYSLKPNMLQLGFLKLIYGSDMRENHEKYPCIYSDAAPYEVIETPWISAAELKMLHSAEDALERMHNSGRFKRTLNYLISDCGYEPFELFLSFGMFADINTDFKKTLDGYTKMMYEYFSANGKRADKALLRDMLVIDRIATNSSGYIPGVLKIEDDNFRKIRLMIDQKFVKKEGVKRGIALLYSERYKNCYVYADYDFKNQVTGEYQIEIGSVGIT